MQLILEIVSESNLGKKIWLSPGQKAEVGRSAYADLAVTDRLMSGLHFSVACNAQQCCLRDLNSCNGTAINGLKVTESTLRDRDTIVAGRTHFAVQLEGVIEPPPDDRATLPKPAKTMMLNEATTQPISIGPWICACIPPQWEIIPDQGFRWTGESLFPTNLILLQSELPSDTTLEEYVDAIIKQLVDSLPESHIEGPTTAKVAGADRAVEFTLTHSKNDSHSICQHYRYACCDRTIGTATLIGSATDLLTSGSALSQIVNGLSFMRNA